MFDQYAATGTSHASPAYFDFLTGSPQRHGNPRLFLVRCRKTERIVGFMPVRDKDRPLAFSIHGFLLGHIGPRCLQLLGQPIIDIGAIPCASKADLLMSLLDMHPAYSGLLIPEMTIRDGVWPALQRSAARSGYLTYLPSGIREKHVLPLPSSYDRYLGDFSGKHRYNIRRQERRLAMHFDAPLQLLRIARTCDLPRFLTLLGGLVGHRIADRCFRETSCEDLADQGLLLCYALVSRQRAVAIMFGTRLDSTVRVHKLYHDDAVAHFSPGACMLHKIIEDLIEHVGVNAVDFGYGSPVVTTKRLHRVETCADGLLLRSTRRLNAFKLLHSAFSGAIRRMKSVQKRLARVSMQSALKRQGP